MQSLEFSFCYISDWYFSRKLSFEIFAFQVYFFIFWTIDVLCNVANRLIKNLNPRSWKKLLYWGIFGGFFVSFDLIFIQKFMVKFVSSSCFYTSFYSGFEKKCSKNYTLFYENFFQIEWKFIYLAWFVIGLIFPFGSRAWLRSTNLWVLI